MAPNDDHLLRRHPERPRRADARTVPRRRRRELTLAYVRHTTAGRSAPARSSRSTRRSACSSAAPAGSDDLDVERRVVVSASTGEGLAWLAEQEEADIVVFGSDYRTAAGHVSPQPSAQTLLEGGPAAVAIAPGELPLAPRRREIHTDRRPRRPGDDATIETARQLADRLGATVSPRRAPGRPAGRRLARGGPRGPRDAQLAGAERDRERDLPGARASRAASPVRVLRRRSSESSRGLTGAGRGRRAIVARACGRLSSPICTWAARLQARRPASGPSRCDGCWSRSTASTAWCCSATRSSCGGPHRAGDGDGASRSLRGDRQPARRPVAR